ncbi:MAG TPA: proton-conducting transporter membrane subunit, partial [Caulobacteraceae bacterium]|nr:proton-conducting transporter membrane subunit [Caulobacteraceae bacterium]
MALTLWLAALAPLAFLIVALAPERAAPILATSRPAAVLSLSASLVGLAAALLLGPASTPLAGVAGLGFSVRIEALSGVLATLIGAIGLIVVAYSRNYLAGDPRQGVFVRTLCGALGLVQGLVLSGNLGQVVVCWIATSLCLGRLLLFRGERQAAVLAARKRFLVSRLSDVCLAAAAILLWSSCGSGDIATILAAARHAAGPAWGAAAILLALAAALSSAQLPFHGWILEVMETPTPVSALLHAGVVNAGGFLILRFAGVVAASPEAMALLIVVGAATALFGSLVMLAQSSVKVGLAYSTIGQMGFMLLECGLGAFPAALLHIVAHAL